MRKFQIINRRLGRLKTYGISRLMIPNRCEYKQCDDPLFNEYNLSAIWERLSTKNGKDITQWKTITDPQLIDSLLSSWQRAHFTQAFGSPLTSKYFEKEFQDEETQNSILNGKYKPQCNIPIECATYLLSIRKPAKVSKEITSLTSLEDFTQFIYKSKEKVECFFS